MASENGYRSDGESETLIAGTLGANSGRNHVEQTYVAATITANYGKQLDNIDRNGGPPNLIYQCQGNNVGEVGALRKGNGAVTGGVPFVFDTTQITSTTNRSNPQPGDPTPTLSASGDPLTLAFSCKDHGADAGELSPTLRAMEFDGSHANGGGQVAIAVNASRVDAVQRGTVVRRLTPRECERLQGLPDDWTLVSYRGKPASDGPRYKAIGNSMAVPCVAWIGRRIVLVDDVCHSLIHPEKEGAPSTQ